MSRMLSVVCVLLVSSLGCSDGQETSVTVVDPQELSKTDPSGTDDPSESNTEEGGMEVITIRTNTQATIGDLRIGSGNIWEDTYETQAGNTATGLGAGVSVFVRGDDSQNVRARVHTGDTLEVAGRRIEVRDITEDSVILAITTP